MPSAAATETLRDTYALTETVASAVVLHLESPEIIASTSKYRVDITLNNVAVLEMPPPNVSGAGVLMQTMKGEATAVGSTEPLQAVIYDNQSTAY
jgi:hypothetical protein